MVNDTWKTKKKEKKKKQINTFAHNNINDNQATEEDVINMCEPNKKKLNLITNNAMNSRHVKEFIRKLISFITLLPKYIRMHKMVCKFIHFGGIS